MASDGLLIAEQCIDRQEQPYLFRGHQVLSVTGRVLLHAVDGAGRPLCGRDGEHLAPTSQPWQASYLPGSAQPAQIPASKIETRSIEPTSTLHTRIMAVG